MGARSIPAAMPSEIRGRALKCTGTAETVEALLTVVSAAARPALSAMPGPKGARGGAGSLPGRKLRFFAIEGIGLCWVGIAGRADEAGDEDAAAGRT